MQTWLKGLMWQRCLVLMALLMAGCASKGPQGYGVSKSTASMAQAQLALAEQSTQVDTASTYLGLIEQMQQAGHWYASLAHTEAFEAQHGQSPEVQLLRADALRNTQQYDAAKKIYMSLLTAPQASRAYRGMGLLEANQGHYEAALRVLEQARKLNPIDANTLSDIGYAYMRSGQLDQAHVPVMQAAQLAPTNPRVQLNLALYWLASGADDLGWQLLQKLQQPQPKGARPVINQDAVRSLQEQLVIVKSAVQARSGRVPQERTDDSVGQVVRVSSVVVEPVPRAVFSADQTSSLPKDAP